MDKITIYRGDTKDIVFNVTTSGTGSPFDMTSYTGWLVCDDTFSGTGGSPYIFEVSGTVAAEGSIITFSLGSANTSGLTGTKAGEFSLISGTEITTVEQFWIEFRPDIYKEETP